MKLLSLALSAIAIIAAIPALAQSLDTPIIATVYDGNQIIKNDRSAWLTGGNGLYVVRWGDGRNTRIEHDGKNTYLGNPGDQERVVWQEGKGFFCYIGTLRLCIAQRKIGG